MDKKKVLFVCVCNFARSQMVEALNFVSAFSLGFKTGNIEKPPAVEVFMAAMINIRYPLTN